MPEYQNAIYMAHLNDVHALSYLEHLRALTARLTIDGAPEAHGIKTLVLGPRDMVPTVPAETALVALFGTDAKIPNGWLRLVSGKDAELRQLIVPKWAQHVPVKVAVRPMTQNMRGHIGGLEEAFRQLHRQLTGGFPSRKPRKRHSGTMRNGRIGSVRLWDGASP